MCTTVTCCFIFRYLFFFFDFQHNSCWSSSPLLMQATDALGDSSYCNAHKATAFLQFHMNIRSGWFDLACFMQVLIREEFTLHQDIILETHHLYIVITVNVVWYNCLYIIYLVVFGICIWCIVVCYSQFCDARQYIRKGFHVYLRKKCFFDHRLIFCWHLT